MKKLRIDEWIIQLLQAMYFTKCEVKCTLKIVLVRVIVQMLGCTSALSLVHSFSLQILKHSREIETGCPWIFVACTQFCDFN